MGTVALVVKVAEFVDFAAMFCKAAGKTPEVVAAAEEEEIGSLGAETRRRAVCGCNGCDCCVHQLSPCDCDAGD